MSICTAMVQVDCCGWVVCNKPAENGNRCIDHIETHAVENMQDQELFAIVAARIRADIAGQMRVAFMELAIDELKELMVEEADGDHLPPSTMNTIVQLCIDKLEALK